MSNIKKFSRLLILLVLTLTTTICHAVTVTDLFTGIVPVSAQTTQAQSQGFQAAFQQVLIKMSGNQQVLQNPAIKTAIASAANYVKEFSYSTNPTAPNSLFLNVTFQQKAIMQLLQQNQLPTWGTNRPLLVVWIVTNNGSQAQLVGTPAASTPWVAALLSSANQRGLPIVLPLLDISDIQTINPNVLLQDNITLVQTASNRYNGDGFVILQINTANPSAITTQWNSNLAGKNSSFTLTGNDLGSLMIQGINKLSDQLAQQYAITTSAQTTQAIQLQISGLNNVNEYAAIDQYLRTLTGVTNVTLQSLSQTEAVFNLNLNAPLPTIQQQLNLSHILSPAPAPVDTTIPANNGTAAQPAASTGTILNYQYSPH